MAWLDDGPGAALFGSGAGRRPDIAPLITPIWLARRSALLGPILMIWPSLNSRICAPAGAAKTISIRMPNAALTSGPAISARREANASRPSDQRGIKRDTQSE